MTDLRVQYTVTEASLLAGLFASTDFIRSGLGAAVGFGIVVGLGQWGSISSWNSPSEVWGLLWRSGLGGIAFGAIMTALCAFVLLPIRVRRLLRQNPLIYGEMELEANNDQISVKGPRASSIYAWSELRGFKEVRQVFVIALSKSISFAIPKAGMASETENPSVRSLRVTFVASVPEDWLRLPPVGENLPFIPWSRQNRTLESGAERHGRKQIHLRVAP